MGNKSSTNQQLGAIKRCILLGRRLREDHSEIADLYRDGNSAPTISKKLDIQKKYGVGDSVAINGIYRAISGYNGDLKFGSYVGLIPDKEERKRLEREHKQDSGREVGRGSIIAQGKTLWVTEGIPEIEYAYALTFLPEYRRGSQVSNELIALELNIEYHDCEEIRTPIAVASNLCRYRKFLEEIV
jgi:hypothetical protein|tara:strand:- start:107 stop:664 length:558 start_codon:yes stop_codon:yes gene_type:complete